MDIGCYRWRPASLCGNPPCGVICDLSISNSESIGHDLNSSRFHAKT